ncbi:MAG: hypothetical protein RI958_2839 [Actinomycetota bacterium]|jgi:Flp pilus assembly protein TadB
MTSTPLGAAALATGLLSLAVWCGVRALRPRLRTVAQVRAILHRDLDRFGQPAPRPAGAEPISNAVAHMVERRLATGLPLIGVTSAEAAARIVTAATVMSAAAGVLVVVGALAGVMPRTPWMLALVPVFAAGAVWAVASSLRRQVRDADGELRRTTNDVVQLLAVGLTTDQSVESALEFALGVGDSAMFAMLRSEIASAPLRGVSLWEAVDEIGRRTSQRELCELATAIERQGTQGVSISDTVATLARAMRERVLADLERDADRANANLAGPTVAFVCTTLVFLAYPLVSRISEAFGAS